LYISETTVKKHVSNIFEKMGIGRREEILRIALDGKE
ncbi:MAG: LuxR C-terminal-related transcriptional regulator, partial [Lachnospiraceae bacterium]|nr:LuxR C-terminal-related transcriptional regulator [Lachnospiraceae bacterium]